MTISNFRTFIFVRIKLHEWKNIFYSIRNSTPADNKPRRVHQNSFEDHFSKALKRLRIILTTHAGNCLSPHCVGNNSCLPAATRQAAASGVAISLLLSAVKKERRRTAMAVRRSISLQTRSVRLFPPTRTTIENHRSHFAFDK